MSKSIIKTVKLSELKEGDFFRLPNCEHSFRVCYSYRGHDIHRILVESLFHPDQPVIKIKPKC